jgi:hypothetical protein
MDRLHTLVVPLFKKIFSLYQSHIVKTDSHLPASSISIDLYHFLAGAFDLSSRCAE